TGLIVHDPVAATILPLFGVGAVIETRRHLPQWSFLAAQLLSALLVASVVYLIYAGAQPFVDRLGLLGTAGSIVLLLLEARALARLQGGRAQRSHSPLAGAHHHPGHRRCRLRRETGLPEGDGRPLRR